MKYYIVEMCDGRVLGVHAFAECESIDAINKFKQILKEQECEDVDNCCADRFYRNSDYSVELIYD